LVALGGAAEGVQGGEGTGRGHPEDGASEACRARGHAVEIAVAGLDEGAGMAALAAAAGEGGMQGGEGAGGIHLEDGAPVGRGRPTSAGRAVEEAVARED